MRPFIAEKDVRVRWGERFRTVRRNLLPGYVMVPASAVPDANAYLTVLQTAGVVKFVGGAWPNMKIIPDSQIRTLDLLLGAETPVAPASRVNSGRPMQVERGALKGLRGRMPGNDKRVDTLLVTVESFECSFAVEVDAANLQPICVEEERFA